MQNIPTHCDKYIKVFRCFCLILKVWIIASICYSEQAVLHDAGSRSSFIVTNLWQPKILFILLQFASYAEYNTMRCCPGLLGEITNSNWHLKWFPDEREEGTIKTYFDASCQLGPDTDTRMTKWKQGTDAGKPEGALMGSLTILLGNLQQCFVKIILSCLWCWEVEPKVTIWENCAGLLEFAEINYISDSSHPYLSTGQLGGNSYDNWKLRSDFNLRRWKNVSLRKSEMSSLNRKNVFRDTLIL